MAGISAFTPAPILPLPRGLASGTARRPGLGRLVILLAAGAAAILSLVATQGPTDLRSAANIAAVVTIAVLLMRGPRRRDAMRRTRILLLCALGAPFVAGLMPIVYGLVAGHPPPSPWLSDLVAMAYVPFVMAGLLSLPAAPGSGQKARALADGALAASSLWYLLVAITGSRPLSAGGWAGVVSVAYPAGDVLVVACGLAVLARCASGARRMVVGIVVGLSVEAINDLWQTVAHTSGAARASWLLYQVGLLVLIAAASSPAVFAITHDRRSAPAAWALGVAPFLPLFGCMIVTTRMVLRGANMPHAQVIPALAVAVALAARQLASSRERQRLLEGVQDREKSLEAALRRDHLTGLANRLGVNERLEAVLRDPSCWPVAIALLDLNDFKLINDNHGHAVGDAVLGTLAARLASRVRPGDVVARLGGDEFAVVACRVHEHQRHGFGQRLVRAFDDPVDVAGQRFSVGASIGVVIGESPETASELLAHADAAMYEAKEGTEGKSRVRILTGDDRARASRHMRIRQDIAIPDLRQFHVVYQPVVDLATGRIRGLEALARWNHPELGPIPPDTFIPFAEQAGSISELGAHVLATAMGDLARLQRLRPEHRLATGINVSPRQLATPGFAERVLRLIDAHGLANDQIVLEITEQAFEADLDPVADSVEVLAAAGVSIAVDDFGTGYSSLRYLQRLRLEIMKIDRSFVAEMSTSRSGLDLVAAVAAMGSTLGLQIVAEGIETVADLRLLQGIHCELGQGYLFSVPVPIAQIERLVAVDHTYLVVAGALSVAAG